MLKVGLQWIQGGNLPKELQSHFHEPRIIMSRGIECLTDSTLYLIKSSSQSEITRQDVFQFSRDNLIEFLLRLDINMHSLSVWGCRSLTFMFTSYITLLCSTHHNALDSKHTSSRNLSHAFEHWLDHRPPHQCRPLLSRANPKRYPRRVIAVYVIEHAWIQASVVSRNP